VPAPPSSREVQFLLGGGFSQGGYSLPPCRDPVRQTQCLQVIGIQTTFVIIVSGLVIERVGCMHEGQGADLFAYRFIGPVVVGHRFNDPVGEARGILRSRKSLSKALLNERRKDRRREDT